jgi:prefoldin beta subunit
MEANQETEKKISQLQMLEQNMQNILSQKQTFQTQLIETEAALSELEKTTGKTYKIIGNIMVSLDKKDLSKDLEDKKEVLTLRLTSIEKQEDQLRQKSSQLQEELLKEMKGKEK